MVQYAKDVFTIQTKIYEKLDKNIDNVQMKIQSKKINSLSERVNIIKNI